MLKPWLATIDVTTTLAVMQTVAGFGSILAAIGLTYFQARHARRLEQRKHIEFIRVCAELLAELLAATEACQKAQPNSPHKAADFSTRNNWTAALTHTRIALSTLRDHAPPDARLIMVLVRIVHELDGAAGHNFSDGQTVTLWTNALLERLRPELKTLRELKA